MLVVRRGDLTAITGKIDGPKTAVRQKIRRPAQRPERVALDETTDTEPFLGMLHSDPDSVAPEPAHAQVAEFMSQAPRARVPQPGGPFAQRGAQIFTRRAVVQFVKTAGWHFEMEDVPRR